MDKFINKIINGDCVEELKNLPSNSVNLIITSPPHNIGIDFSKDYCNITKRRIENENKCNI